MKYCLAPYVQIGFKNHILKIGYGSIQILVDNSSMHSPYIQFAYYLLTPRNDSDMLLFLMQEQHLSETQALEAIQLFKFNHILIRFNGSLDYKSMQSRELLFLNMYADNPLQILQTLANKSVAIVGCGGVGSHIASMLANKGIGHLILADNDTIELSNLNRSFIFQSHHVGHKKNEILFEYLSSKYPHIHIDLLHDKLNTLEKMKQLEEPDFIVVSGDSMGLARLVNQYSYPKQIPFIIAGYLLDIVVWGPTFVPTLTPCYECFAQQHIDHAYTSDTEINQLVLEINKRHTAPATPELTVASASFATLDIIKCLAKLDAVVSLGKRMGYWTNNGCLQVQSFTANPSCNICYQKTINKEELSWVSNQLTNVTH